MKHKTAEFTGALLDAAVAKAMGLDGTVLFVGVNDALVPPEESTAVMRAFVTSKLGDEVELP